MLTFSRSSLPSFIPSHLTNVDSDVLSSIEYSLHTFKGRLNDTIYNKIAKHLCNAQAVYEMLIADHLKFIETFQHDNCYDKIFYLYCCLLDMIEEELIKRECYDIALIATRNINIMKYIHDSYKGNDFFSSKDYMDFKKSVASIKSPNFPRINPLFCPSYLVMTEKNRKIPPLTFIGCEGLLKVEIGENIQEVGYFAFKDCINLHSIYFKSKELRISPNAFEGCANIQEIYCDSSAFLTADIELIRHFSEKCVLYVPVDNFFDYSKKFKDIFQSIEYNPYVYSSLIKNDYSIYQKKIKRIEKDTFHKTFSVFHGVEEVCAHHRRSYFRKDGTFVRDCYVRAHIRYR